MFLKIMGALPGYIYALDDDSVYVSLFVGGSVNLTIKDVKVGIRQATRYPWDGEVRLAIEPEREVEFALNVRLPQWCNEPKVQVNGRAMSPIETSRGYARLDNKWKRGDVVEVSLPMPVQRVRAHPKVDADIGRVALQRGPVVYCLEATDNNGHVRNLVLSPEARLTSRHRSDLLGGVTVIEGPALAVYRSAWPDRLYLSSAEVPGVTNAQFTAIPYFANANRQPGEMTVWIAETPSKADAPPSPTLASGATPSASHCWPTDTVSALNDQIDPPASDDTKMPRFTWWDHRGTKEWVQYDFDQPTRVSAVELYWWDERRIGAHCRVPQSWSLFYQAGGEWKPITGPSGYGTEMDRFNRVTFDPVETKALRLGVQLQPDWSGGVLEWKVR